MKTFYAIVHKDRDSAFGVQFPDAPGCFSAADALADVLPNAAEARALYFDDAPPPEPSDLEAVRAAAAADLRAGAFLVAVPLIERDARVVRANISLDRAPSPPLMPPPPASPAAPSLPRRPAARSRDGIERDRPTASTLTCPAILEQMDTTIVRPPGGRLTHVGTGSR